MARTILRVFLGDDNTPIMVICDPYDNNKTVLTLLLSRLVRLFHNQGQCWGTVPYYVRNSLPQRSGITRSYHPQKEEEELHGVAFWRPSGIGLPYHIDGFCRWEYTNDDFSFLTTNIHRWFAD